MISTVVKSLFIGAISLPALIQANWQLAWHDEFDGTQIDKSKWNYDIGGDGWGNQELEYYTDRGDNSYVKDGFLHIQAKKENYGGRQYTSARMKTQGKFSQKFGKFEARAKLPKGQGVWPAFWLLGDNISQVGWPACGEIDILEVIGKQPTVAHGSLHANGFDTTNGYNHAQGFADDYHIYGVEWHSGKLSFYVDGNTYFSVDKSASHGDWPFDRNNFFIILNLAIGGNWPGNPDGNTHFPSQFIIDYVRVYKYQQGHAEVEDEVEALEFLQ
ncbi:glycoside hydrolase family 16 [Stylonychia lemnae]|uniref:Glycoside hydrolase family 16 n=1 Tax=Stylonychia lemnae TaxID=5949 RepID=A0A078ACI9_STYLE|nr:glycoside hydrolase family 16 [Stylonychia lemnae]|eukprot:CDW79307.1 glycoside hydrolase family 16 [Stylonychia lemnae]